MKKNKLYKLFYKLWRHLNIKRRISLALLLLLMVFASIAEMLSIGAILPFLAVFTSPEKIYNFKYSKAIFSFLNINNTEGLLFYATFFFYYRNFNVRNVSISIIVGSN